jgi:chromosome segregation ATPase
MLARNLTVNLCSQLQTASQHIHELDRALTRYYVIFAQLKAQPHVLGNTLHQSLTAPESLPASKAELAPSPEHGLEAWYEDSLNDPVALQAIVDAQHQKIAELGAELNKQFQQQTHIKQRCQLLAAERDHYKQQVDDLRRENENLRSQLAQPQPRHKTIIPQWRSNSQEINPLFRFKPEQ